MLQPITFFEGTESEHREHREHREHSNTAQRPRQRPYCGTRLPQGGYHVFDSTGFGPLFALTLRVNLCLFDIMTT